MKLESVVFCEDFTLEINYYLQKYHNNKKAVLVTTEFLKNKFDNKLALLGGQDINLQFVCLPNSALNNNVFFGMLQSKLQEDTSCLIAFGSGELCDIVKCVATAQNLPYVVVPTACSAGGYALNSAVFYENNMLQKVNANASEFVLVDNLVISQTPTRMVANAYAYLSSAFIVVLDVVFNKSVFGKSVDIECVTKIEQVVCENCLIPSSAVKNSRGIADLFKRMMVLEENINKLEMSFYSHESVVLALHSQFAEKLMYGEAVFVVSAILLQLFEKFFNVAKLNQNFLPNISRRAHNLEHFSGGSSVEFAENVWCKLREQQVFRFMSTKQKLHSLVKSYKLNSNNALSSVKNFYNDKLVFIKKYLHQQKITNAISIAPDICLGKNILSFMRNFGLLDIF